MKMKFYLPVILFVTLLNFGGMILPITAQNETVSCQNRVINDSEKRDFVSGSFSFDLDGDGKADTITAKTFEVKVSKNAKAKIKETHWISFDLKTSKGKTLKSFFKYKYGDNRADYWIYALLPCSGDRDGKTDLLFYTGDDTSDETIVLKNTGNLFKVISRKVRKY